MAFILICDDDLLLREMLADALNPCHTVLTASDGLEGLQLCLTHKFDLIITDLTMPNMSGLELIFKVKSLPYNVKIIAHSGLLHLTSIIDMTLEAGADSCLVKPVPIAKLEKVIRELSA